VSTAVYNLVNGTAESKSLRMFEKDLSGSVADGGEVENVAPRVFPRYTGGFHRGAGYSGPQRLGRGFIPMSERTCHRCFQKGHLRVGWRRVTTILQNREKLKRITFVFI
jgi:hypothetical protein